MPETPRARQPGGIAIGWMVAARESAALAAKLIAAICAKQGIAAGQLTIEAGRSSSCIPIVANSR